MMNLKRMCLWSAAVLTLASQALVAQNAVVRGRISDATSGEPLPGATVLVVTPGTTTMVNAAAGAAADVNGRYEIDGLPSGDFEIRVTLVGYSEWRQAITTASGQTLTVNIPMREEGILLNTIVVSGSRAAEKVLDAPASIDVLTAAEIEVQATQSAALTLRNVTGVDLAQTGADHYEIVLRGFNNVFSGATYVMTDYRQTNAPSLNANVYSVMPISNIDLERVEVVRGPGSALYGAGVDAGVIHFISKDPFTHPGTTVAVTGGDRALIGFNARHAGTFSSRLGYKVTGLYSQVNDWELDRNDPDDRVWLNSDAATRNYDHYKFNVNGLLEYRMNPKTTLTLNGGYSGMQSIVLSGIGTLQGEDYRYQYLQARLQSGRLFAQAYYNRNDAGGSFVYGSGQLVVDNSTVLNTQVQYDLDTWDGRQRFIIGSDFKLTTPKTKGTIYGRNEASDEISEVGGYVQSTTQVSPKLDLTLAGRLDYNNIIDNFQFSPRAALVYKANETHSFRLTYNRAFSSPGNNALFLDIPAAAARVAGPYFLVFQGRGSSQGFTFDTFRNTNAMAFSLPIPGLFGQSIPYNAIPLQVLYGLAFNAPGGVKDLLLSTNPLPAPLDALNDQPALRQSLVSLLEGFLPLIQGGTAGEFGGLPDATEPKGYAPRGGPVDIDVLKQTTSQVVEVGYKGIFGGKVLLTADAYYRKSKNWTGPLLLETPIVYVTNQVVSDLAGALAPLVDDAAANSALLRGFLASLGLSPAQAAGLVAGLMGGGLTGLPAGVIQPDQQVLGDQLPPGVGQAVGGMLAYRNFGEATLFGVDVGTQIMVSRQFDLFGSVSWVSDDLFDDEELNEPGTGLELAINAPAFKFKLGSNYTMNNGVNVNVSGRYVDEFPVRSGPYVGIVDAYFLLDLGAGYALPGVSGMRIDALMQNVLGTEHRQFVGAPKMGRFSTVRLTYSF